MTTPQTGESQASDGGASYRIDPVRFEELKRSFEVLLLTRRCDGCQAEQEVDVAHPPPVAEQIAHILECCSHEESFIKPGMPMQEIVFRMILAGGNIAVPLSQLHYQITEQWATPGNLMNVSVEGLRRVLETDDYYGFRRAE
jgi:hypothetical protein